MLTLSNCQVTNLIPHFDLIIKRCQIAILIGTFANESLLGTTNIGGDHAVHHPQSQNPNDSDIYNRASLTRIHSG